jgi:hypothetical protein
MNRVKSYTKFTKEGHKAWAWENDVHVDLPDPVFDFCLHLINEIKPKNILCLGGYSNLDVFFATKELDYAVNIINVDPIMDANEPILDIKKKHELIQRRFNFKGNYTWIKEYAVLEDLKKYGQADIIWDAGCFELDDVKFVPANQTLFYCHYRHPRLMYSELKEIDKITPMQAFSKSIAFYGNIQKHIKKIISPEVIYRSAINLQTSKLKNDREFFWPYNKKRVIPYVTSGKPNEWKHYSKVDL